MLLFRVVYEYEGFALRSLRLWLVDNAVDVEDAVDDEEQTERECGNSLGENACVDGCGAC